MILSEFLFPQVCTESGAEHIGVLSSPTLLNSSVPLPKPVHRQEFSKRRVVLQNYEKYPTVPWSKNVFANDWTQLNRWPSLAPLPHFITRYQCILHSGSASSIPILQMGKPRHGKVNSFLPYHPGPKEEPRIEPFSLKSQSSALLPKLDTSFPLELKTLQSTYYRHFWTSVPRSGKEFSHPKWLPAKIFLCAVNHSTAVVKCSAGANTISLYSHFCSTLHSNRWVGTRVRGLKCYDWFLIVRISLLQKNKQWRKKTNKPCCSALGIKLCSENILCEPSLKALVFRRLEGTLTRWRKGIGGEMETDLESSLLILSCS